MVNISDFGNGRFEFLSKVGRVHVFRCSFYHQVEAKQRLGAVVISISDLRRVRAGHMKDIRLVLTARVNVAGVHIDGHSRLHRGGRALQDPGGVHYPGSRGMDGKGN